MSLNKTFVPNVTVAAANDWNGLQAAWDTYAPSWTAAGTNPTIGNGSVAGRWRQIGKTIDVLIVVTFGSVTNPGAGQWSLSLPVAALSLYRYSLHVDYLDLNVAQYTGRAVVQGSSAILFAQASTAGGADRQANASTPLTMATGDVITVHGRYEAA